MTENERLADEVVKELEFAIHLYKTNRWTAEQFLRRFKIIMRATKL